MARYDDGKRGPGVVDAISLSECWIELRSSKIPWELPEPPRRMAEVLPDEHAVESMLRDNVAMRRLIGAIKSGALPIWVAPIDGPERVAAPNAFLELGRESIIAGVYRPYNDHASWLYGYPLFVKRADWASFLSGLPRVETAPEPIDPTPMPADEEIVAKMQDLKERGMRRDEAAKHIRTIPGFEAVGNEHARRVSRGMLGRGRPVKGAAK